MANSRALIPRKLMDDAAAISVTHDRVIEVEGNGFKLCVTPATGEAYLAKNDDLDDLIAKGEGF